MVVTGQDRAQGGRAVTVGLSHNRLGQTRFGRFLEIRAHPRDLTVRRSGGVRHRIVHRITSGRMIGITCDGTI